MESPRLGAMVNGLRAAADCSYAHVAQELHTSDGD
jgi:hypothetical protein